MPVLQKIYVVSLDMDGCGIPSRYKSKNLYRDLRPLIDHIAKSAHQRQVTKVHLISGSARQDLSIEVYNVIYNNSTYTPVILYAVKKMLEQVGIAVILHKYLMADRYPNPYQEIAYGTTFNMIERYMLTVDNYKKPGGGIRTGDTKNAAYLLQSEKKRAQSQIGENWTVETSKKLLLQKQMSYFCKYFPTLRIDFEFIDDRVDLLKNQLSAYQDMGNAYKPINVDLTLTLYRSSEKVTPKHFRTLISEQMPTGVMYIPQQQQQHSAHFLGQANREPYLPMYQALPALEDPQKKSYQNRGCSEKSFLII